MPRHAPWLVPGKFVRREHSQCSVGKLELKYQQYEMQCNEVPERTREYKAQQTTHKPITQLNYFSSHFH